MARLSSFVQVKESSSWNEREVVLGDWVLSLFVEILVGMDGDERGMLRDGNSLCLEVVKLSCEKV